MHQSLPGTRLTGLWWNNSLSFNLIFFCFFSSSFVCLFPWFWLLSFLRRYVHLLFPNASPSLSSQVLLVVRHAFVLFLIFFYTFMQGVFFFLSIFLIFISCLSIDSFEPVCLFSLSFSWWFVHTLLSLWVDRRSPGSFATPWSRLGELMLCDHFTEQSDPLFSVCCGGHSLWSVFFGSCIILFFHTAGTITTFAWLSKLIMNPFTH